MSMLMLATCDSVFPVSSSLPFPAVLVSPMNTDAGKSGRQYCCFHLKGHLVNKVSDFSYFNTPYRCCFLSFPRSKIPHQLACLFYFPLGTLLTEVQAVQEEGEELGRYTNSLLCDTLVQIRLHPPLFYMTAVQLNQPFFSSMANYSLFNTNPSKTKVSWDLIQPNIIHVQL